MEIINRKSKFDFHIEEEIEAGIVLEGWEVKSIMAGHCTLKGSYCYLKDNEVFLKGCKITPLPQSIAMAVGKDAQDRKLLLKKKEILDIKSFVSIKGNSIVPIRIFFSKNGFIKVTVGKASGKKKYDKRQVIKERDLDREAQREMKEFVY